MLYLVHYAELALKGKNRASFEKRLQANLRRALERACGEGKAVHVRRLTGRMLVELPDGPAGEVERRLAETFGVASYARCSVVPAEIGKIEKAVLAAVSGRVEHEGRPVSFAVRARRAEKSFPMTSQEINVRLGAAVQKATGSAVNLTSPALEIGVEVLRDEALVHLGARPGPGGLPAGISGKVLVLISGGIDSPVASWLMMKRGCRCCFIHFHSAPVTDRASQEKVVQLVSDLSRLQGASRLHLVPFLETQREIVAGSPPELRILLYRRFMVRIACALARRKKGLALGTGEALGQVASQTLANLAAVEAASALPVLRPLVGYDKQEIVDLAKRIGTYEISIQPHQDCCSFLMPERVATWASPEKLDEGERGLDGAARVAAALSGVETRAVGEEGGAEGEDENENGAEASPP